MSDSDQDKAEKPVKLVHYTTAEAAYSILSQGELWMRKVSLMSDFKEITFSIELMRNRFQRIQSLFSTEDFQNIIKQVQIQKGLPQDQQDICLKIFSHPEKIIEEIRRNLLPNIYIASFSIKSNEDTTFLGRLSMWRSYGGKASIAIVFNDRFYTKLTKRSKIGSENYKIVCGQVFYFPDPELDPFDPKSENNLQEDLNIFKNLDPTSYPILMKHEGFKEESEWRFAVVVEKSQNQAHQIGRNVTLRKDLKVVRGIPQDIIILDFNPQEDIDYIIVGPTLDIDHAYAIQESFQKITYNNSCVFSDDRIHLSKIPLRMYG
ncbi:MAG: DUF2971 domain-containing protein [Acetobacter sp.]|nr:DUF2971 domain-containing protein [Acetobacter sp.]